MCGAFGSCAELIFLLDTGTGKELYLSEVSVNQHSRLYCVHGLGPSSNIEMWGANPLKRRGEPCFKMEHSKRDVGATVCGAYLVSTPRRPTEV